MTAEEMERALGYLMQGTNNLMLASQAQYGTLEGHTKQLEDHTKQLDAIREIQEQQAANLDKQAANLDKLAEKVDKLADEMRELRQLVSDYLRGIRNGN